MENVEKVVKKRNYTINNRLFDSYLERMNFLNEISIDYPNAISLGSGRPYKQFFNVKEIFSCFHSHLDSKEEHGKNIEEFYNSLGQYNKTKGIINESITKLLENDENIKAQPEDIIMTDGAQEGMAIIINGLFESQEDVLLVSDPSYIGFVGYAKIYGVPIVPVRRENDSIDLGHLEKTILKLKRDGKNPKVLYEVPDFHNPTGFYMPLEKRKLLVELAEKYDFLIVEDNPYGYFRYDVEKIPTLKALDNHRRVIYLGSFSKTLFPSIRLGYIVADQVINVKNRKIKLVEELKKVKSFTSVNTSTLLQAMAGSFIHQQDYSLKKSCEKKVKACRKKRDSMIESLKNQFRYDGSGYETIKWNKPAGGFFLVVDLPFNITDELLKECVENYSVIFCPMSFFCINEEVGNQQIRLAFSNLSAKEIKKGIERLSSFIKQKVGGTHNPRCHVAG
jgi:(S)-3,5-dihydroxyphenylglycine transaminase